MKWLKRKYGKEVRELDPRIVTALLVFRRRLNSFADYLQRKMNRFSVRRQKMVLVFFCLAFAGGSVFVAVASFREKRYCYHRQSISVIPLLKERDVPAFLSLPELSRIHQFKLHVDSLKADEKGRFLRTHPHLMDTVNFLESLYQKKINAK